MPRKPEELYALAAGQTINGDSLDDMPRDKLQWTAWNLNKLRNEEANGQRFNIWRGECQRRLNEISDLVMNKLSEESDLQELHAQLFTIHQSFVGRKSF